MKRFLSGLAISLTICLSPNSAFSANASNTKAQANQANHVMIDANNVVWKDGPASLPKGTLMALMEGHLRQEGPFTARFRFPAGSKIPPHFHPADEHITVLSGKFAMALGEKWDEKALHEMGVGSFMVMNKGVRHFAMTKDGADVQLHGVGPWGITYVNPDDDPAKKMTTSR